MAVAPLQFRIWDAARKGDVVVMMNVESVVETAKGFALANPQLAALGLILLGLCALGQKKAALFIGMLTGLVYLNYRLVQEYTAYAVPFTLVALSVVCTLLLVAGVIVKGLWGGRA